MQKHSEIKLSLIATLIIIVLALAIKYIDTKSKELDTIPIPPDVQDIRG